MSLRFKLSVLKQTPQKPHGLDSTWIKFEYPQLYHFVHNITPIPTCTEQS